MMHHSGIGTYIRSLVPRILDARPQYRFTLIGDPEHLSAVPWATHPHVETRGCAAPIYSIREQIALRAAIPRDTTLFWAPHYNIPLSYRGRLAVTIHDVAHLALPRLFPGAHRRLYARTMYARVRCSADALLCMSDFTAREYTRLVGAGRAAPTTVYSGVEPSWFRIRREGPPHPRPFFLFIGNVKPNKNLRVLVSAFAKTQHLMGHDLVIVGRRDGFGIGAPEIPRLATALGDRVVFTGFVPRERLEQYVAFADALVMPSLYEGFGLPPLEAMAAGCPVIASSAASLPEVCGTAALYFEPSDCDALAGHLLRVAQDAPLRHELRTRGLARAAQFQWSACTTQTLAILDPLATTPR